jgi:hypothetical protein
MPEKENDDIRKPDPGRKRIGPKHRIPHQEDGTGPAVEGARIGRLVSVELPDRFLVDYEDNPVGPVYARAFCAVRMADVHKNVLLWFENNDPLLPIMAGVEQSGVTVGDGETRLGTTLPFEAVREGDRIVIRAREQIEIVCGESSLVMKEDGTILVRGKWILSRAIDANAIQGGTIELN